MSDVVILGAGATTGASRINSGMRPPLLRNMSWVLNPELEIFSKGSDSPKILQAFKDILSATDSWADFELLFTLLQVLETIRVKIGGSSVALGRGTVQYLLRCDLQSVIGDESLLNSFGLNRQELECLRNLLTYYHQVGMDVLNAPLNLMTFFRRALYEYLYQSILSVHCKYHSRLFSPLTCKDAVVTFNYDLISDYTLWNLGKLSLSSFDGLGFTNVTLPCESINGGGVKFLKVHGSLNWTTTVESLTKGSRSEVYYELPSLNRPEYRMTGGNTTFDLVLPFRHKAFIYESIPIYQRHIDAFIDHLKRADRILLVGKNFLSADKDLEDLIQRACAVKKKTMAVINPESKNERWLHHHESLLNAQCTGRFPSLEAFYKASR